MRKGKEKEASSCPPLVPLDISVYTKTHTFTCILKQIKIIGRHQPAQRKWGSIWGANLFPYKKQSKLLKTTVENLDSTCHSKKKHRKIVSNPAQNPI